MTWPNSARNSSNVCADSGAEPETNSRIDAPISTRLLGRDVEQADINRGHAEKQRGMEIQEFRRGFLLLEALQQPHAAPAREPAMHSVAEPVHVEQRQREQKAIRGRDLPRREKIDRVGGEIVVREHGAFGRAGGAGGVDDAGRIVAVDGPLRTFVQKRPGFACEVSGIPHRDAGRYLASRHQRHRLGIGEDVRDLAVAIENIDRHEDHAQLHASQEQVDHLDAIGQVDAQAVAVLEAAMRQQLRQAVAARIDVAEGVGGALKLQRHDVAAADQRQVKEVS